MTWKEGDKIEIFGPKVNITATIIRQHKPPGEGYLVEYEGGGVYNSQEKYMKKPGSKKFPFQIESEKTQKRTKIKPPYRPCDKPGCVQDVSCLPSGGGDYGGYVVQSGKKLCTRHYTEYIELVNGHHAEELAFWRG